MSIKRIAALLLCLTCLAGLAACGGEKAVEEAAAGEISATAEANGFVITLYADKAGYRTDEEIRIRATLEYTGEGNSVTIWHGEPYISFSISDGKDFNSGGLIMTVLTSTKLEKGKVYEYGYTKSGGYSADDPDAAFWEEFYASDTLKLPAGTYTVTVSGMFHLTAQQRPEDKGPSASLQITVTE